jgi:aryl-alcohol dehydrogenase-like predicted oxidoreductase
MRYRPYNPKEQEMTDIKDTTTSTTRRSFIGAGLGLGMAAALAGEEAGLGSAAPAGAQTPERPAPLATDIIMKTIPGTNERVPAIGLGTFMTFDLVPGERREHLGEVVRRFWEAGGRVFDTSPLYGTGEVNLGAFVSSMGINDQIFLTNKIWSTGEYLGDDSHAEHSLMQSMLRMWRNRIDIMQCHSLINVEVIVPLMRAWKKEGRVRFVAATHHEPAYFGILADLVESGSIDFVQVHYSIATRQAEDRVLKAAADHGVGVFVNMPLEKARLHKVVAGRALPGFASELGIETWSQFFLKWVISHPAITCALQATSNPDHVAENVGALRGPLPDREMRARMVRHMEGIPGFDQLAQMPWYPEKRYAGLINRALSATRART